MEGPEAMRRRGRPTVQQRLGSKPTQRLADPRDWQEATRADGLGEVRDQLRRQRRLRGR